MKTTPLVLVLFLTVFSLRAQTPTPSPTVPPTSRPPVLPPTARTPVAPPTAPAPAAPPAAAPQNEAAGYQFNYQGVDVNQVLDQYANLVNRTLLRGNVPNASIVLKTQSPLTKAEAIEALQAVLALNNIAVVNIGDKFVKVLTPDQANSAGAEFNEVPASQLPDLGSYVTHIVQLRYVKPSVMKDIIQQFGRLPNSVTALDDNGILVIRDYAENVKRMLEMIAKIDVSVPAVYISEVIPIRYAQADDIANALNSLGGQGGATVSVGSSPATSRISGLANSYSSGFGGLGANTPGTTPQAGINTPSTFGQPRMGLSTPGSPATGTPSSATPFQQRLMNIINRASGPTSGGGGGQEPIQVFGQAKIIADERSNSLLIFATKEDMEQIKHVISQLDVLLAQVLIESVVVDYSLGPNTLSFGVSAAQSPQQYSSNPQTAGAGGVNNGQTFLGLLGSSISGLTNTSTPFGNNLGPGLSYFGNIGPRWDVAMAAIAKDSHASIIQRPSIQTSQAKPAQFFVGDTVPYVTSTYNYGGAYGNQSSYSQLSVGVELDVTPFINPDGLVVMQIQQEIDDLNGYTTISGVGQIPNTIKRTLNSEIAVRNQDTVMLGGFIKNSKSTSRSGVPLLQDIPLLGNLFTSRNDSKQREELIVLLRPTVLKTPQEAAINTIKEGQKLPGVSGSMAEYANEQSKLVNAERKKERSHPKTMSEGFFNKSIPTNAPDAEPPQTQSQEEYFFSPVPAPSTSATPPANNSTPTPPAN